MENEMEINGIEYVKKDSIQTSTLGKEVIIRTYSAGVHIGNFEGEWVDGKSTIKLKNARRLYRWRGANTLNEIATEGVNRGEYTRISKPVPEITLLPIEVLPVVEGVDLSEVWND